MRAQCRLLNRVRHFAIRWGSPWGWRVRLELIVHPVDGLAWGDATGLSGRTLAIGRDALTAQLLADGRLAGVDLALTRPGESCRVAPVFDVVEPRAKVDGGVDFPGALGPIRAAGQGRTRVLRGAAVVVLDPEGQPRGQNAVPWTSAGARGRALALRDHPESRHHATLCARARSTSPVSCLASAFLAGGRVPGADGRRGGGRRRRVRGVRPGSRRGRLAAACRLRLPAPLAAVSDAARSSRSSTVTTSAICCRRSSTPNEVFDGAVVRNYRPFGLETYAIQNHAIVSELYRRHGSELDFAGVVATCAQNMLEERETAP